VPKQPDSPVTVAAHSAVARWGNHVESVRQIDRALKINPKAASAHEAFSNRGNALQELMRFDDTLVAGSTSRLSCKTAGTTRTLMPFGIDLENLG
jgi:hypothetical protein